MLFQIGGDEMIHQCPPPFHVGWLILVHHGAVHGVIVAFEDFHRVGRGGGDFFQHVFRGKQDVIPKHGFDVIITGHHPIAQFGGVKHRKLIARPAQGFGRVQLIGAIERIEAVGHHGQIGIGDLRAAERTGAARIGLGGCGTGHVISSLAASCGNFMLRIMNNQARIMIQMF